MITICINATDEFWKNSATLFVGLLGFTSAILTLIYSHYNSKRNLNFILEKDKRDREERLRMNELDFSKDKWERQRAYNRVLGSFLKVYHSYIKHKYLFDENGVVNMPDQYLVQILDKIDNFNSEIDYFKKCVANETEILPELTVYLHEILDLLGRFELLSSFIPIDPSNPESEKTKVIFQRAHTFAVQEMLDDYFTDLIEKLAQKADVSEEFLQLIKDFNSDETVKNNIEIQQEIMTRMMQSISRQIGQEVTLDNFL